MVLDSGVLALQLSTSSIRACHTFSVSKLCLWLLLLAGSSFIIILPTSNLGVGVGVDVVFVIFAFYIRQLFLLLVKGVTAVQHTVLDRTCVYIPALAVNMFYLTGKSKIQTIFAKVKICLLYARFQEASFELTEH